MFGAERNDLLLGLPPQQRILRLAGDEALDAGIAIAASILSARPFAKADIARLALRTTSVSACIVSSSGVSAS